MDVKLFIICEQPFRQASTSVTTLPVHLGFIHYIEVRSTLYSLKSLHFLPTVPTYRNFLFGPMYADGTETETM